MEKSKKCPQCQTNISQKAKKCPNCQGDLRQWHNRHPILILLGLIIIFPIIISILTPNGNKNAPHNTSTINTKTQIVTKEPIDRIEQIVGQVGSFTILVFDLNADFADNNTPPPYEVIVNAGWNQIEDCFSAKRSLYEVTKNLYNDSVIGDDIVRVIFSAPGYLRSSLGTDDANNLGWSGISNYWKVMLQYKPYENETGSLETRTWGVSINNCR